ncbi:MAG: class I SAM-dependent methyltransferase [Pirellulales bacterium]
MHRAVRHRVFANRHRAIESLPKGGVVAEVGTQTGHFANHIFKAAKPDKLHLFDLSLEWFDSSLLEEPIRDGLVEIHLGDSSTGLSKFPAEHFDWLYIDGDHSYAGVKKDIAQAVRAVKHHGLLVFNDYTVWSPLEACNYGVLKAINELVNSGEWEFLYLALHPWGYHDAALRRRGL